MDKLIEKKLTKPLAQVRKNIDKRIAQLEKDHAAQKDKYNIVYKWDKKHEKLVLESDYLKGEMTLDEKTVAVYAQIPFLMRPFKAKILSVLEGEVDKVI